MSYAPLTPKDLLIKAAGQLIATIHLGHLRRESFAEEFRIVDGHLCVELANDSWLFIGPRYFGQNKEPKIKKGMGIPSRASQTLFLRGIQDLVSIFYDPKRDGVVFIFEDAYYLAPLEAFNKAQDCLKLPDGRLVVTTTLETNPPQVIQVFVVRSAQKGGIVWDCIKLE